jgi:hypothetical protein
MIERWKLRVMIESRMIPRFFYLHGSRRRPSAHEVARDFIPMPNINHLDGFYSDEIDQLQRAVSKVVFLPNLLQHYLET